MITPWPWGTLRPGRHSVSQRLPCQPGPQRHELCVPGSTLAAHAPLSEQSSDCPTPNHGQHGQDPRIVNFGEEHVKKFVGFENTTLRNPDPKILVRLVPAFRRNEDIVYGRSRLSRLSNIEIRDGGWGEGGGEHTVLQRKGTAPGGE